MAAEAAFELHEEAGAFVLALSGDWIVDNISTEARR
jgi:hypothetical protein